MLLHHQILAEAKSCLWRVPVTNQSRLHLVRPLVNMRFSAGPENPPSFFVQPARGPWSQSRPCGRLNIQPASWRSIQFPTFGTIYIPPSVNLQLTWGPAVSIAIDNVPPPVAAGRRIADRLRIRSLTAKYPLFRAISNF